MTPSQRRVAAREARLTIQAARAANSAYLCAFPGCPVSSAMLHDAVAKLTMASPTPTGMIEEDEACEERDKIGPLPASEQGFTVYQSDGCCGAASAFLALRFSRLWVELITRPATERQDTQALLLAIMVDAAIRNSMFDEPRRAAKSYPREVFTIARDLATLFNGRQHMEDRYRQWVGAMTRTLDGKTDIVRDQWLLKNLLSWAEDDAVRQQILGAWVAAGQQVDWADAAVAVPLIRAQFAASQQYSWIADDSAPYQAEVVVQLANLARWIEHNRRLGEVTASKLSGIQEGLEDFQLHLADQMEVLDLAFSLGGVLKSGPEMPPGMSRPQQREFRKTHPTWWDLNSEFFEDVSPLKNVIDRLVAQIGQSPTQPELVPQRQALVATSARLVGADPYATFSVGTPTDPQLYAALRDVGRGWTCAVKGGSVGPLTTERALDLDKATKQEAVRHFRAIGDNQSANKAQNRPMLHNVVINAFMQATLMCVAASPEDAFADYVQSTPTMMMIALFAHLGHVRVHLATPLGMLSPPDAATSGIVHAWKKQQQSALPPKDRRAVLVHLVYPHPLDDSLPFRSGGYGNAPTHDPGLIGARVQLSTIRVAISDLPADAAYLQKRPVETDRSAHILALVFAPGSCKAWAYEDCYSWMMQMYQSNTRSWLTMGSRLTVVDTWNQPLFGPASCAMQGAAEAFPKAADCIPLDSNRFLEDEKQILDAQAVMDANPDALWLRQLFGDGTTHADYTKVYPKGKGAGQFSWALIDIELVWLVVRDEGGAASSGTSAAPGDKRPAPPAGGNAAGKQRAVGGA